MTLTGGCACGKVRYEITDNPLFVHACHCTDCQRSSGSAFIVNVLVDEHHFDVTGATSVVTLPTPGGTGYDAYFCPNCATIVWCNYHFIHPSLLNLRGGTLDDANAVSPSAHIFTCSKQAWLMMPEGVPCFDEMYDPVKAWPEDTLEKFAEMSLRNA